MAEERKHEDARWLRSRYVSDGKTAVEIADECSVSVQTICRRLDAIGIDRGRGKTPDNTDYRDPSWLKEMYVVREKTVDEIADACDVTRSTISRWLNKHDIQTRAPGMEVGQDNPMQDDAVVQNHPICGVSGEDHPFYKNGSDWRRRQPWIDIRQLAIERDDEQCQSCGMSREDHFSEYGRDLDVHHIVPVSEGGRKYDPANLTTLCRQCHARQHQNSNDEAPQSDWVSPETAQYGD